MNDAGPQYQQPQHHHQPYFQQYQFQPYNHQQQYQQQYQQQQQANMAHWQGAAPQHKEIPVAALTAADVHLAELMLHEAATTYAATAQTTIAAGGRKHEARADGQVVLRGADAATVQDLVRLSCPGVDQLVDTNLTAVRLHPMDIQARSVSSQPAAPQPAGAGGRGEVLQDAQLLTRDGLTRTCQQRAPVKLQGQLLHAVDQAVATNRGLRGWLYEAHALFKVVWESDAWGPAGLASDVRQVLTQCVDSQVALAELLIAVYNLLLRGCAR
jgi:hypothetical protein